MAASEVVVAASQVATTVAQSPVNWYGIVASSAAIGATITAIATLYGQRQSRKHEKEKLAEQRADEHAKLAAQRAPAQLDAALMLEAFARQAVGYLDGCEAQINNCYAEQHGDAPEKPPKWTPLTVDVSIVADWSAVPIAIVSQCRELPLALEASAAWIREAVREWASDIDAYQLDGQRAILYGLLASELANQIRIEIKVPASTLSTDSLDRLRREFDRIKQHCVDTPGMVELIPDLKARLMRELPKEQHDPRWLPIAAPR